MHTLCHPLYQWKIASVRACVAYSWRVNAGALSQAQVRHVDDAITNWQTVEILLPEEKKHYIASVQKSRAAHRMAIAMAIAPPAIAIFAPNVNS